jgi:hypothetical protein
MVVQLITGLGGGQGANNRRPGYKLPCHPTIFLKLVLMRTSPGGRRNGCFLGLNYVNIRTFYTQDF